MSGEYAQQISTHYDAIAHLWDEEQTDSSYGIEALMLAMSMCGEHKVRRTALDIGCGSGGRMIKALEQHSFQVTGIDCSASMLEIAHRRHPAAMFIHADIITWNTSEHYDLILAWDSLFHLPYQEQEHVLLKLISLLKHDGIMLFTFGDDIGEHISEWHDRPFYYSSLGVEKNMEILQGNDCRIRHLELDQYPLKHCVCIAKKGRIQ